MSLQTGWPMASCYKIRSALAIPLAVIFLLLTLLLFMACRLPLFRGEWIVVTTLLLLALYLMGEVFSRRIVLKSEGLEVRRLFHRREVAWEEITHMGYLVLGTKVYLLLTTICGLYILSNNYDRFPELFSHLAEKLGPGKMDSGTHKLFGRSWKNSRPVYSAWVAVLIFLAVVSGRLLNFFHY